MSEWKTYRLGDLCSRIKSGKGIPASEVSTTGEYPVIGGNGIRGYTNTSNFNGVCAVVGRQGAYCGNVRFFSGEAYMTEHAVVIVGNELADTRYLAYLLSIMQLGHLSAQSAQPGLSVQTLSKLSINIPDISTQRRIVGILGSLDDKIELNRRINANLEAQAQALFRSWFVDIDEKLCQKKKLGDFFNVITGKKDANFSSPHGEYPFFTCSQETLRAPSYSFNGHAILLAGNGDFNIKRYIGKFEAYQRTYVLIPFESKYHTYLYLLIKYYLKEITGGYRGSVIRFITKGNIANFEFSFPKESFDDKLVILDSLYQKFDNNLSESNRLSALRDTLLPKLMAGEINVE